MKTINLGVRHGIFTSLEDLYPMRPYIFKTFAEAIQQASYMFQYKSKRVHTERWQGVNIKTKPEMAMHELTHISFGVDLQAMMLNEEGLLRGNTEGVLIHDIKPNMPWAEDHFQERVEGQPLNPGVQWERWPYGKSAATFLNSEGQFNHNYMERYWPKWANMTKGGILDEYKDKRGMPRPAFGNDVNFGIRYEYGDLMDVVDLLVGDPLTRQAYLPVWFPEDTGGGDKRAPCTIGYHFMMRDGKIDINYEIRSCDFVRHFRDDLYLTARLLMWVLEKCQEKDPVTWQDVKLGTFYIQIGSFHMFRNDHIMMFPEQQAGQ